MNISENRIDDLNLSLTIELVKEDYAEALKKKLNNYRRQADFKGFRKGMAPMALVEKYYGESALAEILNTIVGEQLNKYIEENKLNILGEPLPSENVESTPLEEGSYRFNFDMAIAPEVKMEITAEDKIPYYIVSATAKAVKERKSQILKQYGELCTVEEAKKDDFLIADFEQGETRVEGAYVALRSIKDDKQKATLVGVKAGSEMDMNLNEVFENESDRAAMLKMNKSELAEMDPIWTMTVKEVKSFVDATVCQETFDKIFGEGNVTSEEEFDAKIKEQLVVEYTREADYRFMIDCKEYLIAKANISLPDSFMKRYLHATNEGKFTMEQIEAEYDLFAKDFRWNLIRGTIMREQGIKVTKEDIMKEAKAMAAYQFAMYGMNEVPEEHLASFADRMLSDQQQASRIFERVEDDLTLNWIRSVVSFDKKKITIEKLHELTK
ncbi:MAG: trigger factor [Bacteroidales bacterium]|jgi:trigger factor|nr:trigger factor [Bacteroidales bacterium]